MTTTQLSIAKITTQFAVEHSFRGAVSNAILIAHTQFFEMDDEDFGIKRELKEATPETKMLFNLMTDSQNGVPLVPIKQELINSTDNSMVVFSMVMQTSKMSSIC